jgi:Zn-dependent protease with chaperone function
VASVLAHELGHVVERHGIRTVLQHSIISMVAIVLTGDVSSLTVGLPALLVKAKYSREFEKEADAYALNMLSNHKIPAKYFAAMLERLTQDSEDKGKDIMTYISSHPSTADRIKMIEEAE